MSFPVYAHAGLNCKNMAATEAFYGKYFGFRRARSISLGEDEIVFLKSGGAYLELFSAKESSTEPSPGGDGPQSPGFRHLAFEVENVDVFLKSMGDAAEITLGPLAFDDFIKGWKAVWIKDPDGRIVEVSQGYEDEATGK